MATVEHEAVREVVPVTTADVLNRAADLLEEFGWCQGAPGSKEEGQFCAIGAMWAAGDDFGSGTFNDPVDVAVFMELPGYPREDGGLLPWARWNDAPGRTKAEVVAKLREAARNA